MKRITLVTLLFLFFGSSISFAQEIQTLFKGSRPSGAYGAISNKFTTIKGEYANIAEIYGGLFINRKFLVGLSLAATTNDLKVPAQYSVIPQQDMSWQYGQFGLVTEYVFGSNKVVHFNLTLFSGAGFTLQYDRNDYDGWSDDDDDFDSAHDSNFFCVIEPGVQVEVNLLRWLRLSPGISYRKTFGSDGIGLRDNDLNNLSYNVTLKVGKF